MSTHEAEIRELIEGWVAAINAGDLDSVVAGHSKGIVMFDVPPPERGARGLAEYRETWPPFLDWVASGARFEIDEMEVSAGDEVAYAWALLWCGWPETLAENPDHRLRLTLGLRKESGYWTVAHEHHSFTLETA